jgi:hypothetical protein
VDTTGASLILCFVMRGGSTAPIDSKGNTWTGLTAYTGSFSGQTQLYYTDTPIVGSGHTFQLNTDATPIGIVVALSGFSPGCFDVERGGTTGGVNFPLNTNGSLVPTGAQNLFVAGVSAFPMDSVPTIDSGFSAPIGLPGVLGTNWGAAMSFLVQSGTAGQDPTWTAGAGTNTGACAILASFKIDVAVTTPRLLASLGVGN